MKYPFIENIEKNIRTFKSVLRLSFLLTILLCHSIYAEGDFTEIKSKNFVIHYEPEVRLKKIYRKLHQRRFHIRGNIKPASLSSVEDKITYRVKLILSRVKETLDMYPPAVDFIIKIFKDRKSVHEQYRKVSGKKGKVKAFYHHRYRTIYMSEDDISDSVLAHELAHVIIDNYFVIRPPSKVSEMIAIHVDTNLD